MILYEEWRDITDNMIPGILPYYKVSNIGCVWSTYSNKEMALRQHNGYWITDLGLTNGGRKTISIHRLVMMAFQPIENPNDYEVNHIDYNKSNNMITNLEWSTRSENAHHAMVNNLLVRGEEHPNSIYTEEQIHAICKGLEQPLSYREIAEQAGLEFDNNIMVLISEIKTRKAWTYISSQYTFTDEKSFQLFSNEEIHRICQYLEEGKSTNEILDLFNISDKHERLNKREIINKIHRRVRFKNISKNYNF